MSSGVKWSDDFQSILKDTERNLSTIKSRLEESPPKYASATRYATPRQRTPVSNPIRARLGLSVSAGHSTPSSPKPTHLDHVFQSKTAAKSGDSQISLISSLMKRVEEQSKTISHLRETIQLHSEEQRVMKDEIADLQNRLKGKQDINVGRKLEQLERELRSEITSIQSLLKRNTFSPSRSNGWKDKDISRDLTLQKRQIEEETDSIRREIDTLNMRIGKIEGDIMATTRDCQDTSRKCHNIERDMTVTGKEHRKQQRWVDATDQELHAIKIQLKEISRCIPAESKAFLHTSLNKSKLSNYSPSKSSRPKSRASSEFSLEQFRLKPSRRTRDILGKSPESNFDDDSPLISELSCISDLDLSFSITEEPSIKPSKTRTNPKSDLERLNFDKEFNLEDDPLTEDLLGLERDPTADDENRLQNWKNGDELDDDDGESFTEELLLDDIRDDVHDGDIESELGMSPRSDFTDQLLDLT